MSVIAALTRLDSATDGQLLGRFVQSRDADAFTALVHRLGPTVLAVCRRVCPDVHLAEDAFQAAFLVLARKADSVRPRENVAVWLHGVAYRTAAKARSLLASRRRREVGSPALPETPAPEVAVTDDDTLRQLDAAIAALPERLRGPVVLCELGGRSRTEVATQLGIPEGTLSSRLAEARKRLGDRLRPTAAAAVSLTLAARTAEAAVSGVASETVHTLARGATTMLLVQKLKFPTLVGLAVLAFAAVGTLLLSVPPAQSAPVPKEVKKPGGGGIGVTKGGVLYLLTPDGKTTHEFDVDEAWDLEWLKGPCRVCPSPTGGFPVAVLVPREKDEYELRLIRSADDKQGEVIDLGKHLAANERVIGRIVWSRSGKRFFVQPNSSVVKAFDAPADCRCLAVDAATGKVAPVAIPEGHWLVGEAPDGTLVTETSTGVENEWPLHRVSADGKTVTPLKACPHFASGRTLSLAPDGRTLLTWKGDNQKEADTLFAFDAETGKSADIAPPDLSGERLGGKKLAIQQARWSPDGKRVAFLYYLWTDPSDADKADVTLYVCDRDGSNGAAVFVWKHAGDTAGEIWDAHFEWN